MTNEPEECKRLLDRLKRGSDIAEPAFLHSSLALSDYAVAFMRNAQELMAKSGYPDFALPGGLYLIRHGLELWLKCFLVNRNVDRLLRQVASSSTGFASLSADPEWLGVKGKMRAESLASLREALCAMRSVLVDGVGYPACRQVRQDERDADDAVAFLRTNPETPRERVAVLWMPPIQGHRLMDLWAEAEPHVHDLRSGAEEHATETGGGPVMSVADLKAVCALFNHLDAFGDALRYPAALGGAWHLVAPRWSLSQTSALAGQLAETISLYRDYRSTAYQHSTVGDPDGALYFGGR